MRSVWLVFVASVLKCSAMSRSELEEFSDYLFQTSQLDLNVKKAGSPDDDLFDEDEEVSDHAWEESGKFEGDMILNDRQRRLIVENVEGLSRNGLTDSSKRWPNNELIYFIQREHFNSEQVRAIESGIEDLAQASCVKFRPYQKGDRDAVVIQGSRKGCFAQVGYQGGFQVLNLSGRHPAGRGCFRHGTVIHELLHTLGFYHMQSSPDRDDYIDVIWDNIIQTTRHNFRKYNSFSVSDFGVGYDYDSVLHYSRRAFSSNGKDTLVPKQIGASIGQRIRLSEKDSLKLNKMYCDTVSYNFEADETQKPKKKKKPKNQPFKGHGIGYQQGKTVVINLPKSENTKISHVSTINPFDYISNSPQTVSLSNAALNLYGEKEAYPYHTPKLFTGYQMHEGAKTRPDDDAIILVNKETPDQPNRMTLIDERSKDIAQWGSPSYSDPNAEKNNANQRDENLAEAYQKLAKMIQQKVYPENRNYAFKINKDYSQYYDPSEYLGSNTFNLLNKRFGSNNVPHIQARKPVQMTHGRYQDEGSGQAIELPIAHAYEDSDSSYRTPLPTRKSYSAYEHAKTPRYASLEYPNYKHNWNEGQMRGSYIFKGVPLTKDEWYKKDYLRHNPADYNPISYTDYAMMEHKSNEATRRQRPTSGKHDYDESMESPKKSQAFTSGEYYDEDRIESPNKSQVYGHSGEYNDESTSESPQKSQSYSLFGAPVPLTNSWYKPVYAEDKPQSYSEEASASHENR